MFPLEEQRTVVSNRTRIEILASILNVASKDSLKTHIMYRANLSHKQLKKYLTFLESNQLLEETNDPEIGHRYRITQRGIEFLKDYSRLSSHFTEGIL
jgi:predicted transcriptional regulator